MVKDNITIKLHIDKNQEKMFLRVPFDVPDNVETLTISYSYEGDNSGSLPRDYEKNVIDLAVLDQDGNEAGATGSNKKRIVISASYSTPGYNKIDIKSGKWTIVSGAYLARTEGVDVTYVIEFTYKHYRWLKGDLHMHSVNSDGRLTIAQLADKAIENGLDFIVSTDHNNFFHNKRLPDADGLTIIPGVEFTHYKGHMNIMGVDVPYTGSYSVNNFEEFLKLNREAKDRGALQSINHPHCTLCPWRWSLYDFHYDSVEVWNGPMRKDNLTTIDWWHNELIKGRKLVALGGSDYHRDYSIISLFAKPTTLVYANSRSKADILEGIKRGRAAIIKSPTSPYILMTSGDAVIGDSVSLKDNTTIDINVSLLKRGHILNVYDAQGIIYSYKSKRNREHNISLKVENKGFVRADIKYRPKLFERLAYRLIMFFMIRKQTFDPIPDFISALTNPIYFE